MYILILVLESQEEVKSLNYSQHKANIFRAAQHETIGGLCVLSLLSIPLSSHPSLSPRGLVFCRWAWRLAPSSHSLQQNQYLRTICAALLPGGWVLTLQLHRQFHPHIKTYQGQIHMPVLCHHYNKKICKVHCTFICHCYAGWSAPHLSRHALLRICQFMRRKTNELAKRPQGILEGFHITIFSFNEM